MASIEETFATLRSDALRALGAAQDPQALRVWKDAWLGKDGAVGKLSQQIRDVPAADRPAFGQGLNALRTELESAHKAALAGQGGDKSAHAAVDPASDPTLPSAGGFAGAPHPLIETMTEIEDILWGLGFEVVDDPARSRQTETDWHNFEALNVPADHPARDMQDTFYLARPAQARTGEAESATCRWLLRTHTSPVQIRYMQEYAARQKPGEPAEPIKMIAPGRVYRFDADATHSPMFHQIEGLWVEKGVTFATLRALLGHLTERLFGKGTQIRFRPSYFPFTEPSAEVDMLWRNAAGQEKWLEILGCGMVHPNVFKTAGLDPRRHQGMAFGMGIERMAMLRYGVTDIRRFYSNSQVFLQSFERLRTGGAR